MSRLSAVKRSVYARLPLFARRAALTLPYGVIAGREYRRCLALCQRLDSQTRAEIVSSQERLLSDLLRFAVKEVPFYERYRSAVVQRESRDALQAFPTISKQIVQSHFEELSPRSLERIPHREAATGGSSGSQLVFLEDHASYAREMGFMHSQWKRVGYTSSCRKATFRGVEFPGISPSCFWQYNPIHNELQFSPFHMSEETLGFYVEKLIEYEPSFLHGYPSAVDVLAEYVIRHGLESRLPPIRAALLGSEACSPAQRARIEVAFRTRVYTWYGHSERTVLGGECECSQAYHAFPAYGILEIVKENGEPCEVGEQGEIVGTGFLNRSMPLIRYRTDDYAIRESCECECGRHWDRFSHVVGRRSLEGFLHGKHGSRISDAALNVHGDCFSNVVRYQYYQRIPGQLVIQVIPNPLYSRADEAKIIGAHQRKLWGEMDVSVEIVKDIPLTPSGKQRRLICDVKVQPSYGTTDPTTEVR